MARGKPAAEAAPLPTRQQWAAYVAQAAQANPQYIPPDQLCQEDITEWETTAEDLTRIKTREMMLRQKVFKWFFKEPAEGVNNAVLPDGTLVKGNYKLNRSVDIEKFEAVKKFQIGDLLHFLASLHVDVARFDSSMRVVDAMGIKLDKLVEWKPSLVLSEYRTLTAEQCAVFEMALEIKPGSPELTVKAKA